MLRPVLGPALLVSLQPRSVDVDDGFPKGRILEVQFLATRLWAPLCRMRLNGKHDVALTIRNGLASRGIVKSRICPAIPRQIVSAEDGEAMLGQLLQKAGHVLVVF